MEQRIYKKRFIRVSNTGLTISYGKDSIKVRNKIKGKRKRNKRVTGEGVGGGWGASPPPFPGPKLFFPRKIGKHKIFTCEEHLRLESIY